MEPLNVQIARIFAEVLSVHKIEFRDLFRPASKGKIPAAKRELMYRLFLEANLTYKQIGVQLKLSETAVRVSIFRHGNTLGVSMHRLAKSLRENNKKFLAISKRIVDPKTSMSTIMMTLAAVRYDGYRAGYAAGLRKAIKR